MITVFLPQANDPENFGILETRRASLVGRLTRPCNPPPPPPQPKGISPAVGVELGKTVSASSAADETSRLHGYLRRERQRCALDSFEPLPWPGEESVQR